ncbi:IS30 family transposase [Enterococcus termitis]
MGQLTAEDRGFIEAALLQNMSVSKIALHLNRHRSTIYREIKRNTMKQGRDSWLGPMPYQATSASNLTSMRRRETRSKKKTTPQLLKKITYYLQLKFSPEQIAFGVKGIPVCTNTIYNWIYNGVLEFDIKGSAEEDEDTKENLFIKKKRNLSTREKWFEDHSIANRSVAANHRLEFGHWEADSVLSVRHSTTALATFVERRTRRYKTYKMAKKTSHNMYKAMCQLLKDHPGAVKSITCDRGSEFINQGYVGLIESKGTKIYLANAYSPQERGCNENHNGLLREYYPKGTDFSKVDQQELNQAVESINNRPRKTLNWKSAQLVFHKELRKATLI